MAKTEKSKKSRISPDALIKPTKKGDIELRRCRCLEPSSVVRSRVALTARPPRATGQ